MSTPRETPAQRNVRRVNATADALVGLGVNQLRLILTTAEVSQATLDRIRATALSCKRIAAHIEALEKQ